MRCHPARSGPAGFFAAVAGLSAVAVLAAAPARAQVLTFGLSSSDITAPIGGQSEPVYGSIANLNDDDFTLDAILVNMDPPGDTDVTVDTSPFFSDTPAVLFGITSGLRSVVGPVDLFNVSVLDGTPPGDYTGTVEILGYDATENPGGAADEVLASEPFEVSAVTAPEPGSLALAACAASTIGALLLAGAGGVAVLRRMDENGRSADTPLRFF